MGALRLAGVAALLAAMAGTGCAARKPPVEVAPTQTPPPESGASEPEPPKPEPEPEPPKPEPMPASEAAEALEAHADNPDEVPEPRLRDLCRKPRTEGVDEASRLLEETFCTATLWFDGLFGDHNLRDVHSARAVSGRVELSNIYTQFYGNVPKARLRVRYDLPALDRRINVFLERDDRDDVVADRREGFALRSSIFGVDTEDRWLAGLGYSPPGRFSAAPLMTISWHAAELTKTGATGWAMARSHAAPMSSTGLPMPIA